MSRDAKTLWTNGGGSSSIARIEAPANLRELVAKISGALRSASEERVKAYRTPVTTETLRVPVK